MTSLHSNSFFFYYLFYISSSLLLSLSLLKSSVSAGSSSANYSTTNHHHHHKWVGPVGHRVITVDVSGLGEFLSVQAAVDSVPENNRMNVLIQIGAGFYIEKVVVPATKPYITFQGAGRELTVIEWHDRACDRGSDGQQLRTYQTASVTVYANYFSARNISFTDCELHSIATRFGSIAAHDRKSPDEKTGFAFVRCRVTGSGPIYVGRAMGQYSRIVYSYTYFDDLVAHGGWDDWDHVSNKNKTAYFGVYKCWGPGSKNVRGVSWARELDYESAHRFLVKSFVNGRHWIAPADA
ncbi:hypothetical protein QYF36_001976 [Acer negundo]|nr:hypothetical protein QYF36_001976 [Acer negundo]